MLTEAELEEWGRDVGLPGAGLTLVNEIRSSGPARRVGGGSRNVWGRYPSKKMGCTIQFESRTVELAAIYLMEHDDNVLEYYDQPTTIQLKYKSASGRLIGPITTPDFFVIRSDCAAFEEWKTEQELRSLSSRSPNRWVRDETGWRCPPGEAYANPLGLRYLLRSADEINPVVVRNLRFLEDFARDTSPVDEVVARNLVAVTTEEPGITVDRLLAQVISPLR